MGEGSSGWVIYPESIVCQMCSLTSIRGTTSLYFYIDKRGNIVLTKDFAVKVSDNSDDK